MTHDDDFLKLGIQREGFPPPGSGSGPLRVAIVEAGRITAENSEPRLPQVVKTYLASSLPWPGQQIRLDFESYWTVLATEYWPEFDCTVAICQPIPQRKATDLPRYFSDGVNLGGFGKIQF